MRILVATDLSDSADEAIRQAHARAAAGDALAMCFVMHNLQPITPLFPQQTAVTIVDVAALETRVESAVRDRVVSLTGRPADGFEVFVEQGVDYAEIVRRASKWKADEIVVGSHGRTGLAHALLGSVAERVARYASCAVRVARAGKHSGPILAATDLSDPSLPAIAAARAEATRVHAPLVAVHAVDVEPSFASMAGLPFGIVPSTLAPEVVTQIEEAAATTLSTAMKSAGATGEVSIVTGEAAPAIASEAKARDARLVVIGTRGRTGLAHIALGSVAERVVRTAPCSVLVVRAPA